MPTVRIVKSDGPSLMVLALIIRRILMEKVHEKIVSHLFDEIGLRVWRNVSSFKLLPFANLFLHVKKFGVQKLLYEGCV
jgi:hypothetical protein